MGQGGRAVWCPRACVPGNPGPSLPVTDPPPAFSCHYHPGILGLQGGGGLPRARGRAHAQTMAIFPRKYSILLLYVTLPGLLLLSI